MRVIFLAQFFFFFTSLQALNVFFSFENVFRSNRSDCVRVYGK